MHKNIDYNNLTPEEIQTFLQGGVIFLNTDLKWKLL